MLSISYVNDNRDHLWYNRPVSKTAVNAAPGKEQRMELTVIVQIVIQIARLIVSVISLVLSRRKPKKRKK